MKAVLISLVLSSLIFSAEVDLKKSHIQWSGEKITGSGHTGKIFFQEGIVYLKDDGKIKDGKFIVDMNSFTVEDLEGDTAKKFLGHMKSDDFFEVKKYPRSTFKINSVSGNTMKGDLTIKNKTRPVEFAYKKKGDFYVGGLEFDRTKFNMIYGSSNFFKNLGDKVIKDKVKLSFKFKLK